MNFRVGQEVVCIKQDKWFPDCGEVYPTYRSVYIVRTVAYDAAVGQVIRLQEITNSPQNYTEGFIECEFASRNFRRAVKLKTDISVFTEMLGPQRELALSSHKGTAE